MTRVVSRAPSLTHASTRARPFTVLDSNVRRSHLPFAQPDLDGTELAEVAETLSSGWLTTGAKTKLFEAEFAAYLGASHAVAVNSCTAAMHLALEAVGLGPGDEVLTTPYTFAATAEVVRYFAARPVFVDVQPDTLNIDPAALDAAVSSRTRAIMPVHLAGHPADLDPIYEVAARHDLAVVEDAAHTPPAFYRDRAIGADLPADTVARPRTHVTCFSFYATKTLTTGEGGMVCTDDHAVAERCRIMSLHGISSDAWRRYTAEGSWQYEVVAPGYKYNMTDLAAALGLAQLRKVERMWRRRAEIAATYTEAFGTAPELQVPSVRPGVRHAWHLYMLRLHLNRLVIDRADFIQELSKRNIGTSVHFIPLHIHPYYRETYGYQPEDFPVAYHEYLREISLPIYSRMTDGDVRDVIAAVQDVVRRHSR